MGNAKSSFTKEQLEHYEDCSFFTTKEILGVFQRYRNLAPDIIPFNMTGVEGSTLKIPAKVIKNMPELKENPFRDRICQVFSEDGEGNMTFEDFLDMFSVFSDAAPMDIKCMYAFQIYDFNGDKLLDREDVTAVLRCLTQHELNEDEEYFVVEKIFDESDLDEDGQLSFVEFEYVLSRSPDFINTFHIRI